MVSVQFTGTEPWSITWSDSLTEDDVVMNPHVRSVSPYESTVYSVTAVSDASCTGGTSRGSARIKVSAPDATISTKMTICASSTRNTASVSTAGKGATYSWSIANDNGTITSGQGTRSIQFTPTGPGSVDLQVTVTSGDGCTTNGPTTSVTIDPGC